MALRRLRAAPDTHEPDGVPTLLRLDDHQAGGSPTAHSAGEVGVSSQPFVCGQPRTTQGRAPAGWLTWRAAADSSPAAWFCSATCLIGSLLNRLDDEPTSHAQPPDEVQASTLAAIAELGQRAGNGLTWLSATPARLAATHERARVRVLRATERELERLRDLYEIALPAVAEQARQDAEGRIGQVDPSAAAGLLAEHLAASPSHVSVGSR